MADKLTLKADDGKTYQFPDGTSRDKVAAYFNKIGVRPTERLSGDYGGGPAFPKPKGFKAGGADNAQAGGAGGSWKKVNAPHGRGAVQLDEMAPPEEIADRIKTHGPAVAAVATAFMQPQIGIPALARMGVGGKILSYVINAGFRVGAQAGAAGTARIGLGMATGESASRAIAAGGEDAKGAAVAGAIGEGVGLGVTGAVKGAQAIRRGVKSFFQKTPGGVKYAEKIREAVTEQAQGDVKAILDEIETGTPREMIGEQAGAMARKFDRITTHRGVTLREIPIQMADRAGLTVDMGGPEGAGILQDLSGILKASERKAGALSPFAAQEGRAVQSASASRTALTDISELGLKEVADIEAAIKRVIGQRVANTSALMEVQGQVSQLLAKPEGEIPLALRRALQKIGGDNPLAPTSRINGVIRNSLSKVGDDAVAAWDASQSYYAKTQGIKEEALYNLIKKSPDKVHAYIAPNQPRTATDLRHIAEETGVPDIVPKIQRTWLEDRVAKGGVEGARREIESYGGHTVANLFREPKAAQAVENVKRISDALNKKLTEVGARSEKTRDVLAEAALRAGLSKIPGGKLLNVFTPDVVVKWAYSPNANKLIQMLDNIGPTATAKTTDALAQAMRSGIK